MGNEMEVILDRDEYDSLMGWISSIVQEEILSCTEIAFHS